MSSHLVSENDLPDRNQLTRGQRVRRRKSLDGHGELDDRRFKFTQLEEQSNMQRDGTHMQKPTVQDLDCNRSKSSNKNTCETLTPQQLKCLEGNQGLSTFKENSDENIIVEQNPSKVHSRLTYGTSSNVINQQHVSGGMLPKKNMAEDVSSVNSEEIKKMKQEHHCCGRKRKRCELNSLSCDVKFQGTGLTCIGILPGVGSYLDSSDDSDQSSSASDGNENVKYDLVGRRLVFESKEQKR